MAVIERFGGCCHGCRTLLRGKTMVVREKIKSRINTVTEVLSNLPL